MTIDLNRIINNAFDERLVIPEDHQRFFFAVNVGFQPKDSEEEQYIHDALTETIVHLIEEAEVRLAEKEGIEGYSGYKLYGVLNNLADKQWFHDICTDDFKSKNGNQTIFASYGPTVSRALYGMQHNTPLNQVYIVAVHWHRDSPDDGDLIVSNVMHVMKNALTTK